MEYKSSQFDKEISLLLVLLSLDLPGTNESDKINILYS
jgi:hypothetical protein